LCVLDRFEALGLGVILYATKIGTPARERCYEVVDLF
jgi:hypothetical protein